MWEGNKHELIKARKPLTKKPATDVWYWTCAHYHSHFPAGMSEDEQAQFKQYQQEVAPSTSGKLCAARHKLLAALPHTHIRPAFLPDEECRTVVEKSGSTVTTKTVCSSKKATTSDERDKKKNNKKNIVAGKDSDKKEL